MPKKQELTPQQQRYVDSVFNALQGQGYAEVYEEEIRDCIARGIKRAEVIRS